MARSASACVKRYLDVLSRREISTADPAALQVKLETVEGQIEMTADPLVRLHLHQQVLDLQAAVNQLETERGDFEQIEEEFIENVADWARSKGISYASLRQVGVPAHVLRKAGMT